MPRSVKKVQPKLRVVVPRIPPTSPIARDEGPRLIPWDKQREPSHTEYLVDLADILLGRKEKV